ncbi:hypothetical protein RMATCC62417_15605 [Rhizopus microsporus]|nr:hypothetical protein RMATCC62417_15605 [Rhizopus microsporus]
MKAITFSINGEKYADMDIGFFPGEEHLLLMSKQQKKLGLMKDDRYHYNADGAIRLQGFHNVEVSGSFGATGMTRTNFDHHKAMFGLLSVLKTLADEIKYGSLEIFEQINLLFVHAEGKSFYIK